MKYNAMPPESKQYAKMLHEALEDLLEHNRKNYGRIDITEGELTLSSIVGVYGETIHTLVLLRPSGIAPLCVTIVYYANGDMDMHPYDQRPLETMSGAARLWVKDDKWKSLVNEAVAVRKAIVHSGGMATKSLTEDILMIFHTELDRGAAHDILNHIESHNL